MIAYTYIEKGKFALVEKPKPVLMEATDAIVRVTMSSICSSSAWHYGGTRNGGCG